MVQSFQNAACGALPSGGLINGANDISLQLERQENSDAANKCDIQLIVSDVDGTLLSSAQELTPGVLKAVNAASDAGIDLMVATGKAVGPWTKNILPQLRSPMPQLFLQGLYIQAPDGSVIHSQTLPLDVIEQSIELADEFGVSFVMYTKDRVVCERRDEHTDRLIFYGEPTPEAVGSLMGPAQRLEVHKVMFMGDDAMIQNMRRTVADTLKDRASITSALSGMLEVLPAGASKGAGVALVLDRIGIRPENCMALGDGENDIEMLELVGLGIAMGNAGAKTKAAAQAVVGTNDEDGVAQAIQKFVL